MLNKSSIVFPNSGLTTACDTQVHIKSNYNSLEDISHPQKDFSPILEKKDSKSSNRKTKKMNWLEKNWYDIGDAISNILDDDREQSQEWGEQVHLGNELVTNKRPSIVLKKSADEKVCWCWTVWITIACSIMIVASAQTVFGAFFPIFGIELDFGLAISIGISVVLICLIIIAICWKTLLRRRGMKVGIWKEYLEDEKKQEKQVSIAN